MKLKKTDFFRKSQFPLMLAFGSIPVPVILLVNMADEALGLSWLLPAAYALLACVCLLIPGKRRLLAGAAGCAAIVLLGAAVLPVRASVLVLALPILYAALLLFSLQIAAWPREKEISFNWYAAGIVAHALAQILVIASHRTGEAQYASVEQLLIASFLCFLLLMLCSLNRSSMIGASMGRQRIPERMRRRNRALTLMFFALVLFVSAIPRVIALIEAGWNRLFSAFLAVVEWIVTLLPAQETQNGEAARSGGMAFEALGEAAEQSLLSQIMEKVVMVLGIAGAVVLLILALRIVAKNLKKLLRLLLDRLSSFASSASEDYEDEITDTREGGSVERSAVLSRLRQRMALRDEGRMSPGERIRYRYLRLLHKHSDWHGGTTARENLPDTAAKLYEQARYSDHPVTQSEAERFAAETKGL